MNHSSKSDDHGLPELTVRAILLGGLITLAFTAANVYLGLKVGLTFATSIPAAVISMAVLRLFKTSSIYRKQHRPNRGERRRDAGGDHLRAAGLWSSSAGGMVSRTG